MPDAAVLEDPELLETAWDLEPLVAGGGEDGARALLDEVAGQAEAFAAEHAGRVAELDAEGLCRAMEALAEIHDGANRAATYASLAFSVDTTTPARGALLQRMEEALTRVQTKLLFFDLEWAALPDARAEELLAFDGLDFCRHHLRAARRYRPHLLTEPEEKIHAEKQLTGRSAWTRLFEQHTARLAIPVPGEEQPLALDVVLSRLQAAERETRRTAAEAVSAVLGEELETPAFIFNTLLADKMVDDRLRGYPTWISSRNLSNEVSDESVQALVSAIRARNDIPQRWYALKAKLLGLPKLADYDRVAGIETDDVEVPWHEAKELVLDSYQSFAPELGELTRRFFAEEWIDAPIRPGKRGGAFCSYATPSTHPFVMLNYTARRRDVLTMAHELGHGVHAALGASQGIFHHSTPLTMAETASVFGEQIVFGRLLAESGSAESRLALLGEAMDASIATVFRQTAMNRFEELVHTRRREDGELAPDTFCELWLESQRELLGDSVELSEGYRGWWSYIPHFIASPGYVYAYSYGQLLALSVYRRYEEEGESFVPRYLELLSAGGSRPPEELAAIAGLDLADPGFWDAGISLVAEQLEAAEQAAREAGRLDT